MSRKRVFKPHHPTAPLVRVLSRVGVKTANGMDNKSNAEADGELEGTRRSGLKLSVMLKIESPACRSGSNGEMERRK